MHTLLQFFVPLARRGWVLLLLAGCLLTSTAQAQNWLAVKGADGVGSGAPYIDYTATDGAGNVYVAGTFNQTVTFGSTSLISSGGYDGFVAKWNPTTNAWVWAYKIGGSSSDYVKGFAVRSGVVYVGGYFNSPSIVAGGVTVSKATTGNDGFVLRLTDNGTTGTFAWGKNVGGVANDQIVQTLAVNGTSVYVGGYYYGTSVKFDAITLANTAGGDADGFVAKLVDATSSASFSWARQIAGAYGENVQALAVSGSSVYAAGYFSGSTFNGSPSTFGSSTLSASGGADMFVAKLTDAGASTAFNWVQGAGGSNYDGANAVAVSGSSVYVGGSYNSSALYFDASVILSNTGSSGSTNDGFVGKFTDNGTTATLGWAKNVGGASGSEQVAGLAVSGSSVYAAGAFGSATVAFDSFSRSNPGTGGEAFVAKLTDAGSSAAYTWVEQAGGALSDNATSLALSGTTLYVGGYSQPPATFGGQGLAAMATADVSFVASLSDTPPAAPVLSSFAPATGPVGTSVVFTGTGFNNTTAVRFNGTAATGYTVNTAGTQLTVNVPTGATTGTLSLTTPGGTTTSSTSFTVILPPTITSFGPASGPVGTSVIINGTNFSNASAVTFNSVNAPGFVVNSAAQITVTVPATATTGLVRVTTVAGTAASSTSYTVTKPPIVSTLTPATGPVGQSVTIGGSNFLGTTAVAFNGTTAPGFVVNSATQITVSVPAGASTGPVSVTTPIGTGSSSGNFTFLPTPALTSFAPALGPEGTSVVLTGTNLDVVTAVRFNGLNAPGFVVNSPTQITVAVPAGATSGNVSVSAPGGTGTSTSSFAVTPGISGFAPGSGAPGTSVIITGTSFTGATAVAFNGTAAPGFVVNSATQLTVSVPIGASTGPVSVTTPAGSGTSGSSFSVTGGIAPVVTAVSVSSYPPTPSYYSIGQTVDFQVTFDRAVTVSAVGAPPVLPIILTTGFGSPAATQLFGNNTTTLTFRYTVSSGDLDMDGLTLGSAIQLAGGTLRNSVDGADAILTLNNVAPTANLIVDGQRPAVISCVRRTPAAVTTTGPDVTFRVTFSEPVYGSLGPIVAANFTPVSTGGVGGTVSALTAVTGGNNAVYDVTLTGINGNGTVKLNVTATTPIMQDAALNHLVTPFSTGEVYTIIPGNIVVNGVQNVGGTYVNVTVAPGATATLTGSLVASGTVTVSSGSSFSSRRRGFFWRAANGSATNGAASGDPCNVVTGTGSFVVEPGATVSICDPAGISATGSTGFVQVSGPRTFSDQASYLYDGDTPQTTGTGLPATVRELALANPAGLTLTNDVAIRESLRLGDGAISRAGHSLTLLSDASGTALVDNSGGGTIAAGPGLSRMQRHIDPTLNPGLGYRHFSSPLLATPQSQLNTAGFALVAPAGFNTSATPRSFSPFPNVMGYDQARLGTSPATDLTEFDKGWYVPTTGLTPGQGLDLNIAPPARLTFAGDFNLSAAVNVPLARGPQAEAGWAFIGNPFPAPFDLNGTGATTKANVEAAVYVFESTAQYSGSYRAFVNGVGNGPQVIAAGQGFFVRAGTGMAAPSFQFNQAGRVTTFAAQPTFRRGGPDLRPQVALALQAGPLADAVYVYAEAGATAGADAAFDAHKLPNPGNASVWAIGAGSTPLAIQGLPALAAGTTVPLTLALPAAGAASFTATLSHLPAGLTVFLTDAVTGTRQNLTTNPTYRFTAPTGTVAGRFVLVFGPAGTALGTSTAQAAALSLYPNPARNAATLLLPAAAVGRPVLVLDVVGREVRRALLPAQASEAQLNLTGLPAGVYTVRCDSVTARLVLE